MEFMPGDDVGPFRIEQVVGRGGSATVYRANDPRFGGSVAVKILASHLARDGEAVEQFVREARALRRVDHDALLTVFDIASTDDGRPYMVLRYADRGALLDRLPANPGRLHELKRLVEFLAASLGALHQQDLVHRDVKPSNVLIATTPEVNLRGELGSFLRRDERFLLGDLGLVKDLATGQVTRGAGSYGYAAPEQRAVVSRVDRQTDVFGASAVVTEAALGRVRRPDETWVQALLELHTQRPELAEVLQCGLADDPADRFVDITLWADALLTALGAHGLAKASRPPTGMRTPRIVAMALATVAAIGLIGVVAWQAGVTGQGVQSDEVAGVTAAAVVTPGACSEQSTGAAQFLVTDITDTSVTLEYEASSKVRSFFVNGRYLDSTRKQSSRYVIEQLSADEVYTIAFADSGEEVGAASRACITTLAQSPGRPPVGIVMPTNLEVIDAGATWATLEWLPPSTGGDAYTLYSGTLDEGKHFPDIVGESGKSIESTSHTFEELTPGETVVFAIRTVRGEDQSFLAWTEYTVPD